MNLYSQKDPRWMTDRLGSCKDTIGQSGCNLCSMSMIAGVIPTETNKVIPFVSGCLMSDESSAKALGLIFKGRVSKAPSSICKAETDHWKSVGVPQHFFVWRPDGMIADPLDYPVSWKKNPYHIVSYRLFDGIKNNEEAMEIPSKMKDELGKYGIDVGDNIDGEKDLMTIKEGLSKRRDETDEEIGKLNGIIDSQKSGLDKATAEIEELSKRPDTCPVPKEVIKEVPVEVVKGVEDLSAVELLRLAIKKFLA